MAKGYGFALRAQGICRRCCGKPTEAAISSMLPCSTGADREARSRGRNLSRANAAEDHLTAPPLKAVIDRRDLAGGFLRGAQFLKCVRHIHPELAIGDPR